MNNITRTPKKKKQPWGSKKWYFSVSVARNKSLKNNAKLCKTECEHAIILIFAIYVCRKSSKWPFECGFYPDMHVMITIPLVTHSFPIFSRCSGKFHGKCSLRQDSSKLKRKNCVKIIEMDSFRFGLRQLSLTDEYSRNCKAISNKIDKYLRQKQKSF